MVLLVQTAAAVVVALLLPVMVQRVVLVVNTP
jgi:hypothetical protein